MSMRRQSTETHQAEEDENEDEDMNVEYEEGFDDYQSL